MGDSSVGRGGKRRTERAREEMEGDPEYQGKGYCTGQYQRERA